MKNIIILIIGISLSLGMFAQRPGETITLKRGKGCSWNNENLGAEITLRVIEDTSKLVSACIRKITEISGNLPAYTIIAVDDTSTAAIAYTHKKIEPSGFSIYRRIYYNPTILKKIESSHSLSCVIFIIAHEMAHHLNSETGVDISLDSVEPSQELEYLAERRASELAADRWAASILAKLGMNIATVEQTFSGLNPKEEFNPWETHPLKKTRIAVSKMRWWETKSQSIFDNVKETEAKIESKAKQLRDWEIFFDSYKKALEYTNLLINEWEDAKRFKDLTHIHTRKGESHIDTLYNYNNRMELWKILHEKCKTDTARCGKEIRLYDQDGDGFKGKEDYCPEESGKGPHGCKVLKYERVATPWTTTGITGVVLLGTGIGLELFKAKSMYDEYFQQPIGNYEKLQNSRRWHIGALSLFGAGAICLLASTPVIMGEWSSSKRDPKHFNYGVNFPHKKQSKPVGLMISPSSIGLSYRF